MSESSIKSFYINAEHERRMGVYYPKDENFHPEFTAKTSSHELNETQFFGFSVPEERIHALTYTWSHPNLGVVSSGVFVAQGTRPLAPALDICDYRTFLSQDEFPNGLLSYKTSGNFGCEVIDPGKHFRTTYLDKERNNSFDVHHRALHPPCVWSSGVHLEQVMRTEGEVILRGKRYEVNGTHVRDRSWGETRSEMPRNVPPITWMTAVFDDKFAFHLTAIDDPARGPIWKGHFEVSPEHRLKFGWVIVDGETVPVVGVSKLTHYDKNMFPSRVEMTFVDQRGRQFQAVGEVVSGFPFNAWHNCRWPICLARWTCGGKTGWGDVQDGQWTDFLLAVT